MVETFRSLYLKPSSAIKTTKIGTIGWLIFNHMSIYNKNICYFCMNVF